MPQDIFDPLFEPSDLYLSLLHLGMPDAGDALQLAGDCARSSPGAVEEIRLLLAENNWRPHLVGAAASLSLKDPTQVVPNLWQCLDRGSWVTPQIAVVLSLIDSKFEENSRTRLEALCPLDVSQLAAMHPLERHSAAGPAGRVERSAKAAKALCSLVRASAADLEWLDKLEASQAFREFIEQDIDAADLLARDWKERLLQLLGKSDSTV